MVAFGLVEIGQEFDSDAHNECKRLDLAAVLWGTLEVSGRGYDEDDEGLMGVADLVDFDSFLG